MENLKIVEIDFWRFWEILDILNLLILVSIGKGYKKKTANYPHFVDKGRGTQMWISKGGGSRHVDKKKFLDMNIINFEKVDKP